MWKVPRIWAGESAYIIAGGPSVARQNVESLKGRRVIVINSSYMVAPWADFLFSGDARWWREHMNRVGIFEGRKVTCAPSAQGDGLLKLRRISPPPPLSDDPTTVVMGRTSLHACINFAVHLGVNRIVLLGADMQAEGGKTHHHAPHIWPVKPGCWDIHMQQLREAAEPLAARGVSVINTSPVSRIDWWPKVPLEEVS